MTDRQFDKFETELEMKRRAEIARIGNKIVTKLGPMTNEERIRILKQLAGEYSYLMTVRPRCGGCG